MTDKPLKDDDKLPDDPGFRQFQETVRNMLNTPPKPHAPLKKGRGLRASPKS